MTVESQMISDYKEIRERLRHPSNAVFDKGIDLRHHRLPPELDPPPPKRVLESGVVRVKRRPIRLFSWPTLAQIERLVCLRFNVSDYDLHCCSRKDTVVYPRHLFFYLAYTHTGLSMPQIGNRGRQFRHGKKRDHTTVLHAIRKIKEMMLVSDETIEAINFLEDQIRGECNQPEPAVASVGECDMEVNRGSSVSKPQIHELA